MQTVEGATAIRDWAAPLSKVMISNQMFHYICCITPKRVTSWRGQSHEIRYKKEHANCIKKNL